MKTFTRVIAVVMLVAMIATLMAACKKEDSKGIIDQGLVGTWTDETAGTTWTFNDDYTCSLTNGPDGFSGTGTYKIENADNGKIDITLEGWDGVKHFTYTATEKVVDLETIEVAYCFYGKKQ